MMREYACPTLGCIATIIWPMRTKKILDITTLSLEKKYLTHNLQDLHPNS
jgi:hypothetical protein